MFIISKEQVHLMLQSPHSHSSHWPLVDIVVLFSTWLCSAARVMLFNNSLWTTIGNVLITPHTHFEWDFDHIHANVLIDIVRYLKRNAMQKKSWNCIRVHWYINLIIVRWSCICSYHDKWCHYYRKGLWSITFVSVSIEPGINMNISPGSKG